LINKNNIPGYHLAREFVIPAGETEVTKIYALDK